MSNPLTTPQVIEAPQRLNELLNIGHDRPFSLLLANYSWMLGAAGGLVILWAFFVWRGRRSGAAFQLTMPITIALIIAGFLNVLAEVRQPSRLIYGYIYGWNYWDTAIIKYGIILLPIFLMLSWWLMFQCIGREALAKTIGRFSSPWRGLADFFSLWGRRYSLFDYPMLTNAVLAVMLLLGVFAPLYSGIFLMNEHGVAIWNTPAQPLIFLGTSVAKGAVILMLFVPSLYHLLIKTPRKPGGVDRDLRAFAICATLFSGIIWIGWMWWIGRFGTIEELRAANLFMGPLAGEIFWNWLFIGLIFPLAVLMSPLCRIPLLRYLAALGVLWGSYAVRVIILIGGQALARSGAGYLGFSPAGEVLWYTGFSFLFLAGFLVLIVLILPFKPTRSLADET